MIGGQEQDERDKRMIASKVRGLFSSVPIKIEEKGHILQLMHSQEIRDCLADLLMEVNQPLPLENYECMKMIADVLRFAMTLFVHEQFSDFKLLYVIMECSGLIYYTADRKRKVYLSSMLYDHGIWGDMQNWRDCIDYMMKLKIEDAHRRKKRKEQLDKQSSQN